MVTPVAVAEKVGSLDTYGLGLDHDPMPGSASAAGPAPMGLYIGSRYTAWVATMVLPLGSSSQEQQSPYVCAPLPRQPVRSP